MKKLLSLPAILLIFVCLSSQKAKADRPQAGEITYQWVSDSTYRFFVNCYTDCVGIPLGTSMSLCVYNSCTQSSFNVTLSKSSETVINDLYCPGLVTKCISSLSSIPGYKKLVYSGLVTLPLKCNSWKFSCDLGTRSGLTNIASQDLLLVTTFDNTGTNQGNSSPVYARNPFHVADSNQPTSFNNMSYDPDGDSLSTQLIMPMTISNGCNGTNNYFISAIPPYSLPNNPLQCNNTFTYSNTTGDMYFTPSYLGAYNVTIKTNEYRLGVLIGYSMREFHVNVNPRNSNVVTPSSTVAASTVSGGQYSGGTVYGCMNQPLSFCWDTKSSNPNSVYLISDVHASVATGSSVSYTNQGKDSVRGCFSWTPTSNDTGLHNFNVLIKDSTCQAPYFFYHFAKTIPIYIWPKTTILNDTGICPGGLAFLKAINGGNYTWSVLSGTPGSLNCFNCPQPIANPTATTQYIVSSGVNSYCGNSSKDTVTVTQLTNITPSVSVTANPPMPVYPWDWVMFTATPVNGGTNPKYQWRKNGFDIAGATAPNYSVTALQTGDTICCVLSSSEPCPLPKSVSSCVAAQVLTGIANIDKEPVTIYPNPVKNELIIEGAIKNSTIQLIDVFGCVVYKGMVNSSKQVINTSALVPGTYLLRLTAITGKRFTQTIVKE